MNLKTRLDKLESKTGKDNDLRILIYHKIVKNDGTIETELYRVIHFHNGKIVENDSDIDLANSVKIERSYGIDK